MNSFLQNEINFILYFIFFRKQLQFESFFIHFKLILLFVYYNYNQIAIFHFFIKKLLSINLLIIVFYFIYFLFSYFINSPFTISSLVFFPSCLTSILKLEIPDKSTSTSLIFSFFINDSSRIKWPSP